MVYIIIKKFYWKKKNPKISLQTLQKNKAQGGLAAPNFQHYYLASQLQYFCKWIKGDNPQNPWLELEQTECKEITISDLPSFTKKKKSNRTIFLRT